MRVVGKRASDEQKDALLHYIEGHLELLAKGKADLDENNSSIIPWDELANKLNNIHGAEKTPTAWRKYWLDLQFYTKQRMDILIKSAENGDESRKLKPLRPHEERIKSIMEWKSDKNVEKDQKSFIVIKQAKEPICKAFQSNFENSRIRSGRATEEQKNQLIKYFEENPYALELHKDTTNASNTKNKQKIWIEITHKLNSIDGTLKTSSKWAKYWNDLTFYTIKRAKTQSESRAQTLRSPSDLEKRILKLNHHDTLLQSWQDTAEINIKQETANYLSCSDEDDQYEDEFDEIDETGQYIHYQSISNVEENSYENAEAQPENVKYVDIFQSRDEEDNDADVQIEEYVTTETVETTTQSNLTIEKVHSPIYEEVHEVVEDENDSESDDNLSDAVLALGSAANSLALALNGLANALKKRKRKYKYGKNKRL